MKLRKEQLAVLGRDKAARKRKEFLSELKEKGLEAREQSPGGDVITRDPLGSETRMQAESSCLSIHTAERRKFELRHDGHLQLRGVTDNAGFEVKYDYDNKGRLSEIKRGNHSQYGFSYDQFDSVSEIRYPDGTKVEYGNDAVGNVLKTVNRNKNIARRNYDRQGRITSLQDWNGNETRFEYDGLDLPEEIHYPTGDIHEFAYNEEGELSIMSVNGREHAHFLRADDDGLYKIDYVDGTFAYFKDDKGRIVEAENENGTVKFEYDDAGRLLKEDTDGRVVEYQRDELGNLTAIIAPDGKRTEFDRDKDHRINRITDSGGKQYHVDYHDNGGFAGIRFPNGASVEQGVTQIGLPSSLTIKSPHHSMRPIVDSKYEYDLCDRLISDTRDDGKIEYRYDNEGRLKEVASADADLAEAFRLDANGNRTADASGACSFNSMNQLTERDGHRYEYNDLGQTTSGSFGGKEIEFRYNGRGQVIEAITPNGKAEYKYDAIGRRILKRFAGKTTRYIWAGAQLLSEISDDGSSRRQRDYVFFAGRPLPIAMRDGEKNYYFHCGRSSEPLAMTDDDGKLVWQAEYTAFGKAKVAEHDYRHQPFRLAGQYYDEETGLHYNVSRYYSADLGRFLTIDPLMEAGGSLNYYNYCDGDPLNRIDPTGEFIFTAIVVGAVIGAVIAAGIETYRQHKEIEAGNQKGYEPLKIAGAAVIGGVIGGLSGGVGALAEAGIGAMVGTGILAGGAVGAGSGVISSVAEQCAEATLKGQELDPAKVAKQAAIDGLVGGAIGMITGGIGGIFARRAKKAAIEASNIVEDHVGAISRAAKDRGEVIMVRPVNPNSTKLIADGHPTKNMLIKGKSANDPPIAGMIPVDPKKSKLGPNADPEELAKYAKHNQDAIDSGVVKKVEVDGPNGEKIEVLAYPDSDKPITADYDLFAVGPKKEVGHGEIGKFDPEVGAISQTEKGTMNTINENVADTGYTGGDVVHHGPANRFEDTLDPNADFPITAFTPDGRIHTIKDKDQLNKFMKKQNKKGQQLEQREAWGLDPSIPTVAPTPK